MHPPSPKVGTQEHDQPAGQFAVAVSGMPLQSLTGPQTQ